MAAKSRKRIWVGMPTLHGPMSNVSSVIYCWDWGWGQEAFCRCGSGLRVSADLQPEICRTSASWDLFSSPSSWHINRNITARAPWNSYPKRQCLGKENGKIEFCMTIGHLPKVRLTMAEKLKHRRVPLLLMPTLKTSKITNRSSMGLPISVLCLRRPSVVPVTSS